MAPPPPISHRRAALAVLAAATVLDGAAGLVFAAAEHLPAGRGVYWAIETATTVGYGDVPARNVLGQVVAVVVMLTVIPLVAAIFSLIASAITAAHVKHHVDWHLRRIHEQLGTTPPDEEETR